MFASLTTTVEAPGLSVSNSRAARSRRDVYRNKSMETNKAPSGAQCSSAISSHIPLLTELVWICKEDRVL